MESYLYLILIYNLIHDVETIKKLLFSLLILYLVINVIALLGSFGIIQVGKARMLKGLRAAGIFGGPNQFAAYIAMFIPFIISMFLHYKRSDLRTMLIVLMVFSFFCLFLTGSRGGMVAAFVGINSIIFFSRKTKSISFIIKLVSTWLIVIVLLLGSLYLLPEIVRQSLKANIIERAIDEEVKEDFRTDYTSGRTDLWKKALVIFIENPIIGSGWHTYQRIVRMNTHNDYLLILSETGIFGLTSLLFIFYRLFSSVVHYRRKTQDLKLYYNSYLAGLFSFMTSMFFQNMFTAFIFFFIFSGLIIKMGDLERVSVQ